MVNYYDRWDVCENMLCRLMEFSLIYGNKCQVNV